jgi:hypothetical protein
MQFQCECLFITPNVSGEVLWCLRFITPQSFSFDVLTAAVCTAAATKLVIFELLALLDIHNSGFFCCFLWSLWEQYMETSARLKLYSKKLCSSIT